MFYVGETAIYINEFNPYKFIVEKSSEIQVPQNCKKFYAVKKGKVPCICFDWNECKYNVEGVSGSEFKSFKTLTEAINYMGWECDEILEEIKDKETEIEHPNCFAYVDGSFSESNQLYGYGVVLVNGPRQYEFYGNGNNEEMLSMRNVSGEILGSMRAIKEAMNLGIKKITIYYDYKGIECWALGTWKRNKEGTIEYYNFIQSVKNKIDINFVKVKAHSGVELNEVVDKLAKKSVGIE